MKTQEEKPTNVTTVNTIRTVALEPNRLLAFFMIAFSFTWLFWIPDALSKRGLIPTSPITELGFLGAWGPLISAIIITAAYERRAGLIALLKKALDYHFKKRWWLSVMLLFPLLVVLAFLMGIATDGAIPPSEVLAEPWILLPAFFYVLFLSGPFEEEFGWRGYALPRLQAKFNPLVSSLILGIVWALWHIPQFLIPGNGLFYKTPIWTYIPTVVAATILLTWIYNNTKGSMLSMLLMHTTLNLSIYALPVLDTSLGYIYALAVFTIAATAVTASTYAHKR